MSKNMFIARSADESILERGESGGAVTAVLKCALENGDIDGVVTVKPKKGDRFSGIPVLITDPKDLDDTAGSLHCSLPNIPRFVKEYLDGAAHMKLAVVGKPCDIRAIIELQKRKQIPFDIGRQRCIRYDPKDKNHLKAELSAAFRQVPRRYSFDEVES